MHAEINADFVDPVSFCAHSSKAFTSSVGRKPAYESLFSFFSDVIFFNVYRGFIPALYNTFHQNSKKVIDDVVRRV